MPLVPAVAAHAALVLDALLPRACAACEAFASGPFCAACAETVGEAPADSPALVGFGGAVQRAINAAKQGGDPTRAQALASFFVARAAPLAFAADAVAFVPAPFRRLARRGFDLPAVLAHALAHARGLPVIDALALTRADRPLSSGASREARATLVRGRYRARAGLADRRLLLVDDVHTTGATLGEARRVLEEAGAAVTCLALAAKA